MLNSTQLKEQTAILAINNMLSKSYFDICVIDYVGEMLSIPCRRHESYKILRTLHCIEYNKIPENVRECIPQLIKDCFGERPLEVSFTPKKSVNNDIVVDAVVVVDNPKPKPVKRLSIWKS